jgi:hypothetical protein
MFSRLGTFGEGMLRVLGVNGAYHTKQIEDHEVGDNPDTTWMENDARGKPCICAYVINNGEAATPDVYAEISVQVARQVWYVIHTSGAIAPGDHWKLPHEHQRNVVHRVRMRIYTDADTQNVDALLTAGHF